jgi:glucose 1-dehydrogenase
MAAIATRLHGKNALITGASSGIGEAIAIRFAQEGANVAINYHSGAERAEDVRKRVEEAGMAVSNRHKNLTIRADVADEQEVKHMFATVIAELGTLDILVNNSGIQKPAASDQLEMADFDRIIGVNLRGAFLCAREAIRHFLSRNTPGVIVNNSSVHEIIPKPKYIPYSISKGGLENLTKTLALEYANRGIRVNAVGPGASVTPINRHGSMIPRPEGELRAISRCAALVRVRK